MDAPRRVICSERLRHVPAQFSWVDQRLVRDRHLERLDPHAAMLYLFLITVADAQGLSWYGDISTARRLSLNLERLRRARSDLVRAGMIAYAKGLYQVLALEDPLPLPAPPRQVVAVGVATATPPPPPVAVIRENIAALHAALVRRP